MFISPFFTEMTGTSASNCGKISSLNHSTPKLLNLVICNADREVFVEFRVAPITIRRDLTDMESEGLVTRCYGGATVPEHENREVPFEVRNKSNFSVKVNLAKKSFKTA